LGDTVHLAWFLNPKKFERDKEGKQRVHKKKTIYYLWIFEKGEMKGFKKLY